MPSGLAQDAFFFSRAENPPAFQPIIKIWLFLWFHFWQPCYSPWLSMALYGVIGYLRDARTTFRGWSNYKRRTGKWPWVSIGVHSLNSVIMVLGTCALIWHAVEHHWARGKFIAILVLLAVFHMVLWTWVSNKAKLAQIRGERRLARTISKSHFH